MTNREFFNAIINTDINADLVAHAKAELEKLDAKNAKRKNTPSKAQLENEPIKAKILEYIASNGSGIASAMASAIGVSTQKISSLCTLLVNEGKVEVSDLKIKGKGTVKQYTLAAVYGEGETDED